MIEWLAEVDDLVMEKCVSGVVPTADELQAAVGKGTTQLKVFSVICGSSFKNKGVQPLLDCVIDCLPSPLDIPPVQGSNPETNETQERKAADDQPYSALAVKIMNHKHAAQLVLLR